MTPYNKKIALLSISCAVTFFFPISGNANVANIDSVYFFHQRTIYLENLFEPGSWWANPATLSYIDNTCFFTTNTGLLGGKYSLSSVRLLFQVNQRLKCGVGITGAGTTEARSFTGSTAGAELNSDFSFKRPSIEAGISYVFYPAGTFALMAVTGTESIPRTTFTGDKTFFLWGLSAGWLSPLILNTFKLSFTTLSVFHMQYLMWWDNSAKTGVVINIREGTILGSLEYGFSLNGPISLFKNQEDFYEYDVFKGLFSVRFRKIAGLLLGFSNDTRNFRDNGPTFHTGVELRRSSIYPFSGGYEVGMNLYATRYNSFSPHLSLIHRFWINYNLKKGTTIQTDSHCPFH